MFIGHGNDGYTLPYTVQIDFSSNIHPAGASRELVGCLKTGLEGYIGNYPEVNAELLAENIAEAESLPPGHVLVANGATGVFYLIAQAFSGASSIIAAPAFQEYEDACMNHGHEITLVARNRIGNGCSLEQDPGHIGRSTVQLSRRQVNHQAGRQCEPRKLTWYCNPNNPDGNLTSRKELARMISESRDRIWVIDEAYIEFTCSGYEASMVPLAASELPNCIVVRSLTKIASIPGLRLGYCIGSPEIIGRLQQVKQPWSVNALAVAAGKYIIGHRQELRRGIETLLADRHHLYRALRGISYLEPRQSDTHYLLVDVLQGSARQLKMRLLEHYGLLVRDASNFRGLDYRESLRICTQGRIKDTVLIKALQEMDPLGNTPGSDREKGSADASGS